MIKTLTAAAALLFAGALSVPALAQTDHMSTGNKTGAMSSGAMSTSDHMSTGAMSSGDHMSTGKKAHKAKKPAKKADAMSSGAMSH